MASYAFSVVILPYKDLSLPSTSDDLQRPQPGRLLIGLHKLLLQVRTLLDIRCMASNLGRVRGPHQHASHTWLDWRAESATNWRQVISAHTSGPFAAVSELMPGECRNVRSRHPLLKSAEGGAVHGFIP